MKEDSPRSVWKQLLLILWLILQLTLVTAMLNREMADFVYAGF